MKYCGGKMKLREIMDKLDGDFPIAYAVDWDNTGLLTGDENADIKKVYIALDVTEETAEGAAKAGADLMITHHPLLFHPLKSVNEQDPVGRCVRRLIGNGINYYAMHTNFDIVKMADLNADDLKIENPEILEEVFTDQEGKLRGFGRIGNLREKLTLHDFAQAVNSAMLLPAVRVYGNPAQMIARAAVSSGSGKSSIPSAIKKGADVLVTGDIDYHTALDACAAGLSLIDAGHYGTEFIFISYMKKYFERTLPELSVETRAIRQPYTVIT